MIGSGSTSFETIRNLAEKLPAMTTPAWVRMGAQPISMRNVASYLVAPPAVRQASAGPARHRVYEIGGADIVTYGDLLRLSARVPWTAPADHPSAVPDAATVGMVALPLHSARGPVVGRQLAESLRHPTVVTNDAALRDFPRIRPMGAQDAIAIAVRR